MVHPKFAHRRSERDKQKKNKEGGGALSKKLAGIAKNKTGDTAASIATINAVDDDEEEVKHIYLPKGATPPKLLGQQDDVDASESTRSEFNNSGTTVGGGGLSWVKQARLRLRKETTGHVQIPELDQSDLAAVAEDHTQGVKVKKKKKIRYVYHIGEEPPPETFDNEKDKPDQQEQITPEKDIENTSQQLNDDINTTATDANKQVIDDTIKGEVKLDEEDVQCDRADNKPGTEDGEATEAVNDGEYKEEAEEEKEDGKDLFIPMLAAPITQQGKPQPSAKRISEIMKPPRPDPPANKGIVRKEIRREPSEHIFLRDLSSRQANRRDPSEFRFGRLEPSEHILYDHIIVEERDVHQSHTPPQQFHGHHQKKHEEKQQNHKEDDRGLTKTISFNIGDDESVISKNEDQTGYEGEDDLSQGISESENSVATNTERKRRDEQLKKQVEDLKNIPNKKERINKLEEMVLELQNQIKAQQNEASNVISQWQTSCLALEQKNNKINDQLALEDSKSKLEQKIEYLASQVKYLYDAQNIVRDQLQQFGDNNDQKSKTKKQQQQQQEEEEEEKLEGRREMKQQVEILWGGDKVNELESGYIGEDDVSAKIEDTEAMSKAIEKIKSVNDLTLEEPEGEKNNHSDKEGLTRRNRKGRQEEEEKREIDDSKLRVRIDPDASNENIEEGNKYSRSEVSSEIDLMRKEIFATMTDFASEVILRTTTDIFQNLRNDLSVKINGDDDKHRKGEVEKVELRTKAAPIIDAQSTDHDELGDDPDREILSGVEEKENEPKDIRDGDVEKMNKDEGLNNETSGQFINVQKNNCDHDPYIYKPYDEPYKYLLFKYGECPSDEEKVMKLQRVPFDEDIDEDPVKNIHRPKVDCNKYQHFSPDYYYYEEEDGKDSKYYSTLKDSDIVKVLSEPIKASPTRRIMKHTFTQEPAAVGQAIIFDPVRAAEFGSVTRPFSSSDNLNRMNLASVPENANAMYGQDVSSIATNTFFPSSEGVYFDPMTLGNPISTLGQLPAQKYGSDRQYSNHPGPEDLVTTTTEVSAKEISNVYKIAPDHANIGELGQGIHSNNQLNNNRVDPELEMLEVEVGGVLEFQKEIVTEPFASQDPISTLPKTNGKIAPEFDVFDAINRFQIELVNAVAKGTQFKRRIRVNHHARQQRILQILIAEEKRDIEEKIQFAREKAKAKKLAARQSGKTSGNFNENKPSKRDKGVSLSEIIVKKPTNDAINDIKDDLKSVDDEWDALTVESSVVHGSSVEGSKGGRRRRRRRKDAGRDKNKNDGKDWIGLLKARANVVN